ncbi:MAG: hypothetical protein QOD84_1581 [Acidobacteriaceae bacterium]
MSLVARRLSQVSLFLFFCLASNLAQALQVVPSQRILEAVDEQYLTPLKGNVHPLAKPQFDGGAAPLNLPMDRMLLVLRRSPEQQAALSKLLDDQQDKSSPNYHRWLAPDQFGQQFGASDSDIQTVTSWLQSHGFNIGKVAKGRNVIEFSGTADMVQQTFHTAIRKFVVNGENHWANASDPQIPTALTPVVAGVHTLHNFFKKPMLRVGGRVPATFNPGPPAHVTFSNPTQHALGPQDFATIYNINPITQLGIDGSGITIAVVGRSDINSQDVRDFRNFFGLPNNSLQILDAGDSPGDLGGNEEFEAVLDTTWAGAVARNANVNLVVSASTNTTDGVDLSELYIIDNNLADVMSESFGTCEANFTSSQAAAIASLAEQAAAQGITYVVSSGDTGAEGCADLSQTVAQGPVSVNMLASTPFNIAVGGTMFNENGQPTKYWGAAPPLQETALSYIPENVWNESCASAQCGSRANIAAGSGGVSAYFPKPSWQIGNSNNNRAIPDVSLTAALHDPYLLCAQNSCEQNSIFFVGGTSASAPAFAGVMALVDQKMGERQGQAGYVLYRLAATQAPSQCSASNTTAPPASNCIFNDVTVGNNAVPGEIGFGTPTAQYQSGAGYDLATGLGSVNVTNLVNSWSSVTFSPTSTTLALNPTTIAHGSPVAVNVSVAPTNGTGLPSGDVSLRNSDLSPSGLNGIFLTLNGGTVSSAVNSLEGGTYHVVAHYAGDATFAPSDSSPVAITVSPEASTTALSVFGVTASGQTFPYTTQSYGSPVYLRAQVAGLSGHGTASGAVDFLDNDPTVIPGLATVDLNAQGTAATSRGIFFIPAGQHSLVAVYGGDVSFNPSNSPPVNMTVTKANTTTSIAASSNVIASSSAVTLTATINTNSGGLGPLGSVTFFSGGIPITNSGNPAALSLFGNGGGNIQNGTLQTAHAFATLTTPLANGQNIITAQYNGDTNYATSSATAATVDVQPDFTMASSSSSLTVARGSSGTLKLTITGETGYNGTVSFGAASCSDLPIESTCSFAPPSVTGTGTTTLTVTTTAAHSAALNGFGWKSSFGISFAGLFLLGVPSKRRRLASLAALFMFASLVMIAGCGGGGSSGHITDPGTPAGSFTVSVAATSGSLTHSTSFTLVTQ